MATNSKHTEGKAEISARNNDTFPFNRIVRVNNRYCVAMVEGYTPEQSEANASRIVTMWNNWDDVILALNNLIDVAQGNNEYECDTNLQNAVEMAKGVLPVE